MPDASSARLPSSLTSPSLQRSARLPMNLPLVAAEVPQPAPDVVPTPPAPQPITPPPTPPLELPPEQPPEVQEPPAPEKHMPVRDPLPHQ